MTQITFTAGGSRPEKNAMGFIFLRELHYMDLLNFSMDCIYIPI